MNETRLKILSGVLFLAVVGLGLERAGVFGTADDPDTICSDGDAPSAERAVPAIPRTQRNLGDLGLTERANAFPETPVGGAMTWALSAINTGSGTLSTEELTQRFAPSALERIPVADLQRAMATFAAQGPYVLVGHRSAPMETSLQAVVQGAGFLLYNLEAAVEAEEPYRITEFRLDARN